MPKMATSAKLFVSEITTIDVIMSLAIIINKLLFRTFLSSKAEEMILQLTVKNQVNNDLEGIAHNIAFCEL